MLHVSGRLVGLWQNRGQVTFCGRKRSLSVTVRLCRSRLICVVLAALATFMPACHRLAKHRSSMAVPYTTQPPADMTVNERARHLNSRGLRAFELGHLFKAEKLFQEALEVDLNFGPAHNNLGQIHLARHQLYLAAWEFEYAANLMPELVEPIINQGLAYETGERIDRAAEFYQQAYHQQPNHAIAIASLVRARIKQDGDPIEIGFLLDELIMHDGRQDWVEWAKKLRATKYRDQCIDCDLYDDSAQFPMGGSFPHRHSPIQDQLLPLNQDSPGREPDQRPPEFEELPVPEGDYFRAPYEPVELDSPKLHSSLPIPNRKSQERLSSAGRTDGDSLLAPPVTTPQNGGVEQVSFDGPLVMPAGVAP